MEVLDEVPRSTTPLEGFIRDYLHTVGGDWDEIEPQVYDVLVPAAADRLGLEPTGGMLRLTFDPEALPEHPGAQLASFGTPLMDALLADAVRRGRSAHFHTIGLNLAPHDLAARVRRLIKLAEPLELHVERARALLFAQGIFWFQAQFVSDQKEQEIVPVAIDLHYNRLVRHVDLLLEPARLAEQSGVPLPEAPRHSLPAAYLLAREEVLRTIGAMANARGRDLAERRDQQIARMQRYYADLRQELADQGQRGKAAADAAERLAARRAAIDQEEQVRVAEMRQKSTLRVQLRLLQVLIVQQPKLQIRATIRSASQAGVPWQLVWDPLIETLEAPPCLACGRPSYAVERGYLGALACPACVGSAGRSEKR